MSVRPEVTFHFNVADPLHYLCRLLRKVDQAGLNALVCAPPELARALDVALWAFAQESFIPHAAWNGAAALRARSPILIADQAVEWPGAQVLVNALPLTGLPPGCPGYAKVVEIVSLDAQEREVARQRWRAYTANGYGLRRHDAAQAGSGAAS